ncbi:MAG: Ig-like domain-containing protein [Kouleothrix sp.]|nr:Ig-like domain-containing protein [Kouleothrix sp.]
MERLRPYLRLRYINAALFALVVLVAALVFGPLALSGPAIVGVTPAEGAADANPQAGIQIVFSQWVRPGSLRAALAFDPPVEFTVSEPGLPRAGASLVIVQPQGGLRYGVKYRLTVGVGVQNMLGRTLDQPLALSFATAPYVSVARFAPEQGADAVALGAPITVEFAAPVVEPGQVAAAAQDPRLADALPGADEQKWPLLTFDPPAPGVGRWLSPTLFGFYPAGSLRAATSYKVALRADVTPDGKARMVEPVSWSFRTAAPLLAGARPYDGATEVPATGEVEVRLEPDVDVASAGQSFSLRDLATGVPVSGSVQPSPGGFLFKPAALLQRGGRYEASLAPGVKSGAGAPLNGSPLSWSFTVIGDLAVAQVEPPPDTTDILTDTRRISVRFNHPVVAVTTLDGQSGQPSPIAIEPALAGSGRWLDTSTYVFTPRDGLAPSTGYLVRVVAGLQDQTGGALRQEYAWQFRTVVPQVFGSAPAVGDQYASPRDPIELIFNQPMDLASLRGAVRLERGGVGLPGTIAAGGVRPNAGAIFGAEGEEPRALPGFVVRFTPAAPLERGAEYTISVAAGAHSSQGSGTLASAFSATFRVAPLPRLDSTDPSNGAGAADPTSNIRLGFSAPMDWASVERNLTVAPKPTQIYTSTSPTELFVYFPLAPDADYRVTVGAAAQDAFGVPLGQDASLAFHTASPPPALALVGAYRLGAYNAYAPARVPVQHVGVALVDYRLFRIDPAEIARLTSDYQAWDGFDPPGDALVKQGSASLADDRNTTRIDLLELGRLDAGAYMLVVNDRGGLADRQIMAVSPYALTIKRSGEQLFVWAVDLATGQPASDLALSAAGYDFNTSRTGEPADLGSTDGEGILQAAFATADPFSPLYLWSPAGARFAFATSNWGDGINPWDFGQPADYARAALVGSVYTDRPIYRPEQTVYLRGAVRAPQAEGYKLPQDSRSIFLTISDPEGTLIFSATLPLSEFGTFDTSFPLEAGAKLGSYTIGIRGQGSGVGSSVPEPETLNPGPQVYGSFTVAEYRKPAFEIAVTPARPDLVQDDTLDISVSARYFSGGAVANAPLRWRLLANPFYFDPTKGGSQSAPAGFTFENLDDAYAWYRWDGQPQSPGGELVAEGQAQTDAQGGFTLKLPAALGKDSHSRTLTLDVEVTDVDGQVIASQGAATVHAGDFYIGLRPEGYVVQAGQPQTVSIVTLDTQGQPAGGRKLSLGVYKREWNSVRQQGPDGRLYWTSSFSDTLVETKDATTDAQGRGSVSFTPRQGGEYRIGAEGRDAAGHAVRSSAYTWVYGGDVFWGVDDTNRVELIADKSAYKPGDTAKILVAAPYPGMRALMTIERSGVIEHRLLTIQGTTELLQVPIAAEYAPNVYVSLVLIKPAGGDVPVPDLRVGLVSLPVSTEQQQLSVLVTAAVVGATSPAATAGPRDQVTYTVKATDYTGKGVRAEVGLALVDKAVLSLADDPNPSFTQAFYSRRPLGVFTAQSLTALVDRVTLRLQPGDKGGGGGLGAEVLVRRNFPDTAYWNPSVVTGDDGTASVTLTLPDNLTTWRMTARALTADTRVGQATSDLLATRPLLVRPALSRFLTVGDKLTIQAVVHNNTAGPIDATVTLELVQSGDALVRLGADAKQTVQVAANSTAVARWPAEALAAGQAVLRFTVEGGGLQDSMEQSLPVQRFITPEVVASGGQVLDTTVETIAAPASQSPGEIDLELAPSLAAGIGGGLDYLEHYPYLCTEQTVSRFLPNAVTYRLLGAFPDTPMQASLKASLDRNLAAGLQRLYALQHLDGGWGWWDNDHSDPYLTAYVVQGLVEARRAGYAVDQGRFDQGIAAMRGALDRQDAAGRSAGSQLNLRSYALFVLTEAEQPDRGRAVALFERREQLDLYARAYLLMTLKGLGGEDDRVGTLVGELMSTAIVHAADAHWEERTVDYWNMSSDDRTTAIALQALVRADPGNFLVPNAVRYLMGRRDGGHWRTTQESAATLMALAEYIAQSGELEADYSYRATLDGTLLKEGTVGRDNLADPVDVVVKLADLKANGGSSQSQITIQRQAAAGQTGKGRLYYTLRMRYYQDAAQVQALDQGLGVRREYIAVSTDTLSPTGELVSGAKLSDVVQVRLTLTVPEDVRYLAVEDMLPAGLEPIDTSLKTASAAARDAQLEGADAEAPYWWYFTRAEIRDDRVALFATDLPRGTYHYTYLARATIAGAFKTLPATAYQMYAPEVFGRSAGATFTVTGP